MLRDHPIAVSIIYVSVMTSLYLMGTERAIDLVSKAFGHYDTVWGVGLVLNAIAFAMLIFALLFVGLKVCYHFTAPRARRS